MDRRTVLAFGLIFLVYVGSLKLYEIMYKPAARPSPATEQGATVPAPAMESTGGGAPQAGETPPEGVVAGASATVVAQSGPGLSAVDPLRFVSGEAAEPVRVTTDLYELMIDPQGARIVRWRGLKFNGPEGQPVELVPEDQAGGGADAVIFERGQVDLGAAPFVAEGAAAVRIGDDGGPRSVVFTAATEGGLIIRKTYTFRPGRYDLDVDVEVAARDGATEAALQRLLGEPQRVRFAWTAGIASTERNKKLEADGFRSFAMVGEELQVRNRRGLSGGREKVRAGFSGSVRFAGVQNKYFMIAGFVPGGRERTVEGAANLDGDPGRGQQTWWLELPLVRGSGASGTSVARMGFYAGPSKYETLKSYGVGLEKCVDLGWKIFHPLAGLILRFMNWLYRWLPNYGVIIILLSVIIKVLFYPLTLSSTRSMKRMQEVAPKMKALQEKYKGNQQRLSEEMMKLYKEEKINPMGGCLPMVLQMPVFIALYQALRSDIALRQAPFVGWINDLGQPDALFRLPLTLPFLGNEFNLLPILMAGSTYWQMKLTPTAPAGGASMAMMNKLMPVMMLFFFYTFPSGLVLYWLVTNLLAIYQTWRIHATTPAAGGAQA